MSMSFQGKSPLPGILSLLLLHLQYRATVLKALEYSCSILPSILFLTDSTLSCKKKVHKYDTLSAGTLLPFRGWLTQLHCVALEAKWQLVPSLLEPLTFLPSAEICMQLIQNLVRKHGQIRCSLQMKQAPVDILSILIMYLLKPTVPRNNAKQPSMNPS